MDTLEEVHRRGEAVKKEDEGEYEDSYMEAVRMAIGRHADETAFMTDVNKATKEWKGAFRGKLYFLSNYYGMRRDDERLALSGWIWNSNTNTWDADGETYPTAEHAYQASKFGGDAEGLKIRKAIRNATTPGKAKTLGGAKGPYAGKNVIDPRDGTPNSPVLRLMEQIVAEKFTNPVTGPPNPLREKLVDTHLTHKELEEANNWGDEFWGTVHPEGKEGGKGLNHLGKILTKLRGPAKGQPVSIDDLANSGFISKPSVQAKFPASMNYRWEGKARDKVMESTGDAANAIVAGLRTSTTRKKTLRGWKDLEVGDIVGFPPTGLGVFGHDMPVNIRITKMTPTNELSKSEWSEKEGWHESEWEREYHKPEYMTYEFELIKDENFDVAHNHFVKSEAGKSYLRTSGQVPKQHIFVFGSNELGIHGKGAAEDAAKIHRAVEGEGRGLTGNFAYALPTKKVPSWKNMENSGPERKAQLEKYVRDYNDRFSESPNFTPLTVDKLIAQNHEKQFSPEELQENVNEFVKFMEDNPEMVFHITDLGTENAGYTPEEISNAFITALKDSPAKDDLKERVQSGDIMFGPKTTKLIMGQKAEHNEEAFNNYPHWDEETQTFDPTGGGSLEPDEIETLGPRDIRINTGFADGADRFFREATGLTGIDSDKTIQRVVGHSYPGDKGMGIPKSGESFAPNVKRQIHEKETLLDKEHEDIYRAVQEWMTEYGKPGAGKGKDSYDKWEDTHSILLKSRNYEQVRNSDAVLGVIEGLQSNWVDSDGNVQTGKIPVATNQSLSGSAYAVIMGILENKPVYVYDQRGGGWTEEGERGGWKEWDYATGDWREIAVPPFYQRIAGIGSRQINKESSGFKAIQSWVAGIKEMQENAANPPFAPPRVWDDESGEWTYNSEEDKEIHETEYDTPYIDVYGVDDEGRPQGTGESQTLTTEFVDMESFPNLTHTTPASNKEPMELGDQSDQTVERRPVNRGEILNITDKKSYFEKFPEMKEYREEVSNVDNIYNLISSNRSGGRGELDSRVINEEIEALNDEYLSTLTGEDREKYLRKVAKQISDTRKKRINKEIDEQIAVFNDAPGTPADPDASNVVKALTEHVDNKITVPAEDAGDVAEDAEEDNLTPDERVSGWFKEAIEQDIQDEWIDFVINSGDQEAWSQLKGDLSDDSRYKDFKASGDRNLIKVYDPEDFDTIRGTSSGGSGEDATIDDVVTHETPRTVEGLAPEAVPQGTGGMGQQGRERVEEGVVQGGMEEQGGREFDPELLIADVWNLLDDIVPDDTGVARGVVFAPLWSGYASEELMGRNYDIRAVINRFLGFDANGVYNPELGQAVSPNTDSTRLSLFNQLRDELLDNPKGSPGGISDYFDLLQWLNQYSPEVEASAPGGFRSEQGYLDTQEHRANQAVVDKEAKEAKEVKKEVERSKKRDQAEEYNTGSQMVETFLKKLSPEGYDVFMSLSEEEREAIKQSVFGSVNPEEAKEGHTSGWDFNMNFPMGEIENELLQNLSDAWARMLPEHREVKMKSWFESHSSAINSLDPMKKDSQGVGGRDLDLKNFRNALGLHHGVEDFLGRREMPTGNMIKDKEDNETGQYYPFSCDPDFTFLHFFLKLNGGNIQADNLLKVLNTTDKNGKVVKPKFNISTFMKIPDALNILIDDVQQAYQAFKETGVGKPKYLNFEFKVHDDAGIEKFPETGALNPRYNPNREILNNDIKTILQGRDVSKHTNTHLINRLFRLGEHRRRLFDAVSPEEFTNVSDMDEQTLLAHQWEQLTGRTKDYENGYPKKGGIVQRNIEFFKRMLTLHMGKVEGEDGVRFKGIQDVIATIYNTYPNTKDPFNPHIDNPKSIEELLQEQIDADNAEPRLPMAGMMSTAGERDQLNPFAPEEETEGGFNIGVVDAPSVFQRTTPVTNFNEVINPELTGEDLFKRFITTINSTIANMPEGVMSYANTIDERVAMERLAALMVGHSDALRKRIDRDFPDDTADLGTVDAIGRNAHNSYKTLKEQYAKLLRRAEGLPGRLSPEEQAAMADFRENVIPAFESAIDDPQPAVDIDTEAEDEEGNKTFPSESSVRVRPDSGGASQPTMFSPESYHGLQPLTDAIAKHVDMHKLVAYDILGKPAIDLLQHNAGVDMGSEKGQELDTQLKALAEFYIPSARGLFHSIQHKVIINDSLEPSQLAKQINWTTIPSEYRLITAGDTESIANQISKYREGFDSLSTEEQRSLILDMNSGRIMNPEAFLDESNPNSLPNYRTTTNQRESDKDARRVNTVATTALRRGEKDKEYQDEAISRLLTQLNNPEDVEEAMSAFDLGRDAIRDTVDGAVVSKLRFDYRAVIDSIQAREGVDDRGRPVDWSSDDVLSSSNPAIVGRTPIEDIVIAGLTVAKAGELITAKMAADLNESDPFDIKVDPVITRAEGMKDIPPDLDMSEIKLLGMGTGIYASGYGAKYPSSEAKLAQEERRRIGEYIKRQPTSTQKRLMSQILDILDADQLPTFSHDKEFGLIIEGADNIPPHAQFRNTSGRAMGMGSTKFKAGQEQQRGTALRMASDMIMEGVGSYTDRTVGGSFDGGGVTIADDALLKRYNHINSRRIGEKSPSPNVDIVQEQDDKISEYINKLMTNHSIATHDDFGEQYNHVFGNLKGFLTGTLAHNGENLNWSDFGVNTFDEFAQEYLDREHGRLLGVSKGSLVPGADLDAQTRRQATSPLLPDEPEDVAGEGEEEAAPPEQHPLTDIATGGSSPVNPNKELVDIKHDELALEDWANRAQAPVPDTPPQKPRVESPGGA